MRLEYKVKTSRLREIIAYPLEYKSCQTRWITGLKGYYSENYEKIDDKNKNKNIKKILIVKLS